MKDLRDVIIRPIVSEKSFTLLEQNVFAFEVHKSASKPEQQRVSSDQVILCF